MGIEFTPLEKEESDKLRKALKENAETGKALRMDPLTTGWRPGEDEVDDVVDAIKSIPCHYANTITPDMVAWLSCLIHSHSNVMYSIDDPDPSATGEMLASVDRLYAALAEEVKRNGFDMSLGFDDATPLDVLLVPHEDYESRWSTFEESAEVFYNI